MWMGKVRILPPQPTLFAGLSENFAAKHPEKICEIFFLYLLPLHWHPFCWKLSRFTVRVCTARLGPGEIRRRFPSGALTIKCKKHGPNFSPKHEFHSQIQCLFHC